MNGILNTLLYRSQLRLLLPLLLVAGCAVRPGETGGKIPDYVDGMRVANPTADSAAVSEGLDRETLYNLLVAEIAGQRDRLDIAVQHYYEVARKTRDPQVIERAIRIAVYARDDEVAADIARLWLEVEPGNTDAHQVLAAIAVRDGEVEAAVRHLEFILNSDTGALGQKLWLIANMLSRQKDGKTILTVMERLVADYHDNADALFAYAHVAVRMDDLELAQRLLRQVLELQPDNLNAVMNYVSVLQKNGNQQVALDWLAENLDEYSSNFNLRLIYARLLTDARRFEDARAQFEKLSADAPNNPDVLYALGLLSLQANELGKATDHFQRLVELGEREQESRYYLGRIAEEQGRLDEAVAYYGSVESGQNYMDAQIRMSVVLTKQDKADEALAYLNGIRPDNAQDRKSLTQAEAEILIHEERYQQALDVYNKALEHNEDDIDLLYSRAMLAEKMDRLVMMERDLRAILQQEPDHAQALNALGYTLADRTDRLQEAHELIKRALEVSPDDFYILDSMGWVLYRLGRLEEAITYLRRALELRKDPEVAAHLGEVLWVKGEREKAREVWETALQATPDDERLLDVIQRFNP